MPESGAHRVSHHYEHDVYNSPYVVGSLFRQVYIVVEGVDPATEEKDCENYRRVESAGRTEIRLFRTAPVDVGEHNEEGGPNSHYVAEDVQHQGGFVVEGVECEVDQRIGGRQPQKHGEWSSQYIQTLVVHCDATSLSPVG